MSDQYPRVVADRPSLHQSYSARGDGPLKVVPADAIVIELGDLPAMTVTPDGKVARFSDGQVLGDADLPEAAERWREAALRRLAFSEYLTAHPPVGEAQVEVLAELLWLHTQNPSGPGDRWVKASEADRFRFLNRATRLLASGRVQVQPEPTP